MTSKKWKKEAPEVLIREHFKVDGQPKRSFRTQELADRVAWLHDMNSYACGFCGNWHLSNKESR